MSTTINVGTEGYIHNPNAITFDERQMQIDKEEEHEQQKYENNKKSPFENWVQVNKDSYAAEDWLMKTSPMAYRIFKFLINNMDGYNSVVCSYVVLQEYFEVSKPTITRAIKLLKDKKYIEIYKSGTANVYCVNKQIVWNSWGKNYKYAKFGANIILSEKEQEKLDKIKTSKSKEVKIKEQ